MDDQQLNQTNQSYDAHDEETDPKEDSAPPENVAEEFGNQPPEDADALHNTDTFESPVGQDSTQQIDTHAAWQERQEENAAAGDD